MTAGLRLTAAVCAAVLLVSGCVHVGHFCAPAPQSQHAIAGLERGRTGTPCLLCVALHAPSLAGSPYSVVPLRLTASAVLLAQPAFDGSLEISALRIRPPPAA